MIKLNVNLDNRSYPIYISKGFDNLSELITAGKFSGKAILVTDTNVDPLYTSPVMQAFHKSGLELKKFVFDAGESSKKLETVYEIYCMCMEHHLDRSSPIIALGGGVTGDMAGFVAATYLRGVPFIQIPTTTLAQADSSVGGKVGVDFKSVKNLIGAFYQPTFVYMNVEVLKTLPDREYVSGLAEVIKHGIIRDRDFYGFLYEQMDKILARDSDIMIYLAKQNCTIKGEIVEKDEKEEELRAILNFGHTIGHAIETVRNFELLHGECVSVGMVGAAYISNRLGFLSDDDYQSIRDILGKTGLPLRIDRTDRKMVYETMFLDKKIKGGRLKFILPRKIGEVIQYTEVPEELIMEALGEIIL